MSNLFLSVSVDLVRGITALGMLEMLHLMMLISSFIPFIVFCTNGRCLFDLNNMTRLIPTPALSLRTLSMAPLVFVLTPNRGRGCRCGPWW